MEDDTNRNHLKYSYDISIKRNSEIIIGNEFDVHEGFQFLRDIMDQASILSQSKVKNVQGVVKENDPNQILTELDLLIGQETIREIRGKYPNHTIIDEEAGVMLGTSPDFVWTIDPIDGTAYLASGLDHWGTMIGLLYKGIPIGGAFSLPMVNGGMTCVSMEGIGVVMIDKDQQITEISQLSQLQDLAHGVVDFGIDKYFDETKDTNMGILSSKFRVATRKLESGGSPYGWIQMMQGNYVGSLCYKASKVWDRVPVHHAVTTLGGVVTEFDGSPVEYLSSIQDPNKTKFGVCAASSLEIHQQMQAIIHDPRHVHLWQNI